jgi:ATP-binding cassette, subfamily C (CFTR/MRP), member 1
MFFLAPINVWVFGVVSKMRREVLKYSDMRVKMMNEILTGIRILKFYAWEKPFGKEVGQIRAKEMEALTRLAYVVAVGFSIILLSTPIIQPIIVFMTYVKIQTEPLSASTAFTTVALFNIMRFPFAFMPMGLLQYIQSRISLKRLERYLSLPELAEYVDHDPSHVPPLLIAEDDQKVVDAEASDDKDKASEGVRQHDFTLPGSVTIQNGTFSWFDPSAAPIKPVQDEEPAKKKRLSRAERRAARTSAKAAEPSDKASADNLSASVHSATTVNSEGGTTKIPAITLKDITCRVPTGSLVAVVGAVGSGKSSFLSAILGEMEPIDGSTVYLPGLGANEPGTDDKKKMQDKKVGGIAYCTQSPWVVNDTLRGNILFGREFKEERYDQVLEACALKDDLVVLPAGDMTEIGERGINLSGGQKARVSLARAMYSADTKLLLLDDPLSAVDAHVGAHLFREAITGDVSRGMTRILVTHHVHVLTRCDMVVIMERGRIKHQGSYDDLVAKGVDFAGAVDTSKMKKVPSSPALAVVAEEAAKTKEENVASKEATGIKAKQDEKVAAEAKTAKTQAAVMKKAGEKLVKDEEREEGNVDGDAYIRYIRAGGFCIALTMLFVQMAGRAAEIMASFWLALWADRALKAVKDGTPFTDAETSFHLGMYALLGFLGVCGLGVRGIFMAAHRLRASKTIHDDLTQSILRAPVAFFDVTPIGRILNRFAADMDKLDLELTQTISQGVNTIMQVIGAFGAILIATKGTFIVALVPIGTMYYFVQKWFRKTSTELQRVTSIANSPIFADFSQTLSGTSTIRAYGVQHGFFEHCKSSFDNMNSSYILVQLSSYWLALRLDTMGGLVAMFIGAVAVGTLGSEFIPAGWLGLALSYSIEVTSYLKFGVQMIAQLEAHMSSVERILFYTDNIKPEAPDLIPGSDPEPGKWPTGGEIEFQNASMRYRDGPLVLKNLSFRVNAGEKIGVCGRTGSGKSSLMIALFRISEIENDGGKLLIDGVDTSKIGTEPLRLNLSIIPQDPVMFSNTVRYNLDPFQYADEEALWTVLRKVNMADAIAELSKGLDEQVAEGGENFSQGQRQLLCIARSLLRNPRILVMDEATASIDNETDANIQQMIRENFKDATVLTIAHRLNTIMDCDRILVLDGGRIAELDSPENLLNKEEGHFKAMVDKSRAAHDGDDTLPEAA